MRVFQHHANQTQTARIQAEQHIVAARDIRVVELYRARPRLIDLPRQLSRQRLIIQRHNGTAPITGNEGVRRANAGQAPRRLVNIMSIDIDESQARRRQSMRQARGALAEQTDRRSLFLIGEGEDDLLARARRIVR